MSEFLLIYYYNAEKTMNQEESMKHREEYMIWMQSLGDTVVGSDTVLTHSKMLSPEGVSDNDPTTPFMGFSTIRAENLDAAIEIAKTCPFLTWGMGNIKVAETMKM